MQWLRKERASFRQFHSKPSVKLGLTDSGRPFEGRPLLFAAYEFPIKS